MKTIDKYLGEGRGLPLSYGGHHLKDSILDGITVDELQTMLVSNLSSSKLNVQTATKEFNELLNAKLKDAKIIAKRVIADMAKTLPAYMKD